jgi:uncharacterized membrane protein (UPF0127 family)
MSQKFVPIVASENGQAIITTARWCSSRWCKLVGYQFRRHLKPDEALILVYGKDSIKSTSIHMFFVFTPLTVVWVNRQGYITHVQLARPWRPYYASPEPASYVIETSPDLIDRFHPGDQLLFQ